MKFLFVSVVVDDDGDDDGDNEGDNDGLFRPINDATSVMNDIDTISHEVTIYAHTPITQSI